MPKNRQVVPGPGGLGAQGGRIRARGLLARSERDGWPGRAQNLNPDAMLPPEEHNATTAEHYSHSGLGLGLGGGGAKATIEFMTS